MPHMQIGQASDTRRDAYSPERTVFVILDFCGGRRTDRMAARLSRWNPGAEIRVLDNASPTGAARSVTHRNATNSFVGGGICDAIRLAEATGAQYLFFSANDVGLPEKLVFADFEAMMDADADAVLISCAMTPDSGPQVNRFPWMRQRLGGRVRQVRQADLICCLIRLEHIRSFGGLPVSMGGWGYAEQIAFHARLRGKKILINDRCAVRHTRLRKHILSPAGDLISKEEEACAVYAPLYGSLDFLRAATAGAVCDEELDVAVLGDGRATPLQSVRRRWRLGIFDLKAWMTTAMRRNPTAKRIVRAFRRRRASRRISVVPISGVDAEHTPAAMGVPEPRS